MGGVSHLPYQILQEFSFAVGVTVCYSTNLITLHLDI